MDFEKIQQLTDDIEPILLELISNSKLGEVFQKHGISATEAVEFELKLDATKLLSSDTPQELKTPKVLMVGESQKALLEVTEPQKLSLEIKSPKISLWCSKLVIPCPINGDPNGCWKRVIC
jgi:hypothetical protein